MNKKRTLYEIQEELLNVLEAGVDVDFETGEVIDEDPTERIEMLEMEISDKIEGVALYIKQLYAESKAIKEEERSLSERRREKELRASRLEEYISSYLASTPNQRLETPRTSLSFRKSTAVYVIDEGALFDDGTYIRIKQEVDRAGLGRALKEGKTLPYAVLKEKQNLQIK